MLDSDASSDDQTTLLKAIAQFHITVRNTKRKAIKTENVLEKHRFHPQMDNIQIMEYMTLEGIFKRPHYTFTCD